MGMDLYHLEKRVREHNGALAEKIISKIIDVLEDDEVFKVQRIEKLVEKYEDNKRKV